MALTQDRNTRQVGQFRTVAPKVAAGVSIFNGAMCSYNADGFLKPSDNTATDTFAGIADQSVDNTGGADGAKRCRICRGPFLMSPGALVQADVGGAVYCTDDDVIANAGNVPAGTLLDFDDASGQALVDPT